MSHHRIEESLGQLYSATNNIVLEIKGYVRQDGLVSGVEVRELTRDGLLLNRLEKWEERGAMYPKIVNLLQEHDKKCSGCG